MLDFNFYNPTRIFFGKDRLREIDGQVERNAKVLITYGGGSAKKSGLIEKVKAALGHRAIFEFSGIEPNPHYETLMKAAEVVRREKIDFIIAVGGGSVIDGTKFITLAARYDGDARDLLAFGFRPITPDVVPSTVPFGAVLTLPATGSEMNNGAVISHEHGKFPVMSEMVFPKFSILDPTVTFSLPKIQVANGVIDAFIHTTEQYLTFPVDGRIQDRFAEGILKTLIEIGPVTVAEPENYDARANHVWSSTMALNGIIGAGVPQDWATHMIGHEITALFGIDHGQTLAIVLPALLDVRRDKKRAKLLQYAERVWNITAGSEDERIDQAIAKTRAFFESLGVKTHLSEHGVTEKGIEDVIRNLDQHGMRALSEAGDQTLDVTRAILKKAF
jgi:NADP-dependent alcohol dehydrogenase